jgi:hypothetical protein
LATSVTTSLPMWLAGCTYDGDSGNDLRNSMVTAMFYDEGIVAGGSGTEIGVLGGVIGGAGLVVNAGTGMTVTVQPGSFVVPVTAEPAAGGYVSTLPSQATLTVATADPSNPRIDIVVAYVNDLGTSGSGGAVEIVTGTAAPSPAAPAAPANSIILCQVNVPAGSTSVSEGNMTDERPFTTATGGVLVAAKGSVTGYIGMLAYDKASNSFYHNSNAGVAQMHTLPWAPQSAALTTNTTVDADATEPLVSVTITTDGSTDIECTYKWSGIEQATVTDSQLEIQLLIDGTQVDGAWVASGLAAGFNNQAGCIVYRTSGALGTTPAAGTHTVAMQAVNTSGGGNVIVVLGHPGRPLYLYVKPVSL